VPRFVAEEHYAHSFGVQWRRWSQVQRDSVNGTHIFNDRFRRYIGDPAALRGKRVLDAGCGAGPFIEIVAPHAAELVALDLSRAIDVAYATYGALRNVHLAQADIISPPHESESFDFVYSIGVIQHTPEPADAFSSLARLVRPGGQLAVWIYEQAHWERLRPRHLMRTFTRHMSEETGMRFAHAYAPRALRLRRYLKRRPGGRYLSRCVPVPDLEEWPDGASRQLTSEQLVEWTIMDTHDWFVTRYDFPQDALTVDRWFRRHGFEPIRREAEHIAIVGTKQP
jgi:SAM-dependent methyltransferase